MHDFPPPRIYSAVELSAFSRLVDMVYEVATAPERWDHILPALAGCLLLPHISRALGVAQRLRGADLKVAACLTALDKLQAGVLLIGRNRAVSFANRAARHLLA